MNNWTTETIENIVTSKGFTLVEVTETTEFHAFVTVTKKRGTQQFRITRNDKNNRGEWLKRNQKGIYEHVAIITIGA